MKRIIIGLIAALAFTAPAMADQALDYKIAYLQEHMKVLAADYNQTQEELKKALAEKAEQEKKAAAPAGEKR